jgi:branched-chain amino acid aminotransferase
MVNYNGELLTSETLISNSNRGFLFGDAVFETLKVVDNKILFFEDHYFRLMASMRIVRMQIPMNFTLEFIEEQVLNIVNSNNCGDSARVRMTVYRTDGGFYLPNKNEISYLIQAFSLENKVYTCNIIDYEIDLYKDFFITKQLLSTIKTNNKIINITGSIYAKENDLQNCILLNNEKNVVEALNGNIFMLLGNKLITPPINDGCLNGINFKPSKKNRRY